MAQKTSLLIPEHFDRLIVLETLDEKIAYLRSVGTPALKEILRLVYDPAVEFDTEIPKYTPDDSPLGLAFNSLYTEYRRFYLFQKTAQHINHTKKQNLLAQILESVHVTEAMLVEKVFAKDLTDWNITEDFVRAAFPDLLPPAPVSAPAPAPVSAPAPAQEDEPAKKPRKRTPEKRRSRNPKHSAER
jgi:ribosomal protein L12E/L44/L45/RPP1/RPP2